MPRKPLVIIVIACCFLLSPLFIVLQASVVTNTPVFGPYNIFAKLSLYDIIVLGLYLVCAVCVYSVKKWGWYVFLLAALGLVAGNITVFFLRPHYSLAGLIIYDLLLTGTAGIFFRREIIAPYFNPPLRWWEQPPRYILGVSLFVKRDDELVRTDISDISDSGVFVFSPCPLPENAELTVTLQALRRRVDLTATVVRKVQGPQEAGYGLRFTRLDAVEREGLRALLADLGRAGVLDRTRQRQAFKSGLRRTAPRYRIGSRTVARSEGRVIPVFLVNLSREGCLIGSPSGVDPLHRKPFRLFISFFQREAAIECEPRWSGVFEGEAVCGAAFKFENEGQRRALGKIIASCRKARAPDRLKTARPLPPEKIEEYALKSPYRIVYWMKRKLMKN